MSRLRRRLSYANVMATVAVFLALGGTSYSAMTIPGKNVKDGSLTGTDIQNRSITSTDILPGTIHSRDVGEGTLNSGDIADGSLLTRDFKAGQLPAGPQGKPGPQGQPGNLALAGQRCPVPAPGAPKQVVVGFDAQGNIICEIAVALQGPMGAMGTSGP